MLQILLDLSLSTFLERLIIDLSLLNNKEKFRNYFL